MTVTLTTVNERGEVQASQKFENAEEATESLEVLEKMGYVTSERPAILEINGTEYEIEPRFEEPAELGGLHIKDPKPMEEVEQVLNEWKNALGITEGDKVFDRDGPSWSNGFEVVSVTGTRADEYIIGTNYWGEKVTVAAENPNYPKYDGVIEVTPIDGNNKEYAYPASRLRPARSVPYPTDGGNDE